MQVARPAYETWLKDTQGVAHHDGEFAVAAPDAFVSEFLQQRMYAPIQRALEHVLGEPVSVIFQVAIADQDAPANAQSGADSHDSPANNAALPNPAPTRAHPPNGNAPTAALNARYTFDRFIVGKSNELAHAAAQAVADNPGAVYNPLGPVLRRRAWQNPPAPRHRPPRPK